MRTGSVPGVGFFGRTVTAARQLFRFIRRFKRYPVEECTKLCYILNYELVKEVFMEIL